VKFIAQKEKAHDILVSCNDFVIKRGMAHSISSYVEDLFAVYVANKIKQPAYQIFIDKVISYKLEGFSKSKSFKPDVFVLAPSPSNSIDSDLFVATHYFDLKTDLGYNREGFGRFIESKSDFIKSIRGKEVWTSYLDSSTGEYEKIRIKISENITYSIIVVIDWNINKKTLQSLRQIAGNPDCLVDFLILLNFNKDNSGAIETNENDFDALTQILLSR
jgi:hypothetical protein